MKSKITLTVLFSGLLLFGLRGQNPDPRFEGYYSDRKNAIDALLLNSDGSFTFTTLDPELGSYESFTTSGSWISEGNEIILNPEKEKRPFEVKIVEESKDSIKKEYITIKLNYNLIEYMNEDSIRSKKYNYAEIDFYLNGTGKRYTASRNPKKDTDININVDNTIRLNREDYGLEQFTRITLGFIDKYDQGIVQLQPKNSHSNYIEIDINHHLDIERTPRNRRILIKGKNAYIHTYGGGYDTSIFGMPLKKRRF